MKRFVLAVAALLLTTSCGLTTQAAAPRCTSTERLALVAQSVPTAAYLPCVAELPTGWRTTRFDARRGSSHLSLVSDRSGGRPVDVELTARCDVSRATPSTPRADGVRSYVRLRSVSPRYEGTLLDVFAGGCISAAFSFPRGPHIPLMEELGAAVGLVRRGDLRIEVHTELGTELDP